MASRLAIALILTLFGQMNWSKALDIGTSVSFDLVLESSDNGSESTLHGTFFRDESKSVFIVTDPLLQWMVTDSLTLTIYYPVENLAFIYNTTLRSELPSVGAFLSATESDFGLIDAGFRLQSVSRVGDTVVTLFDPPDQLKDEVRYCLTHHLGDCLLAIEMIGDEGDTLSRTTYAEHSERGSGCFPFAIESEKHGSNGLTREVARVSNLQIGALLPDSVQYFTVPRSATVRTVDWK